MKKKLITLFVLLLVVASFIAALQLENTSSNSDLLEKTKAFNKKLNRKFDLLNKELFKFSQYNGNSSIDLNKRYNEKNFNKNGVSYFILKSDTVVFWSVNTIPLDYDFWDFNQDTVVHLKNGWYYFSKISKEEYVFVISYLLKHDYKYTNKYLKNNWNKDFYSTSNQIEIQEDGDYPITYRNKQLFNLKYANQYNPTEFRQAFILLLYGLSLIFLLLLFKRIKKHTICKIPEWGVDLFSVIVLVVIRYFMFEFRFPSMIYSTKLFSPYYYANSDWLPSLGDLLINVLLLLYFSIVFFKRFKKQELKLNSELIKFPILLLAISFVFIFSAIIIDSFEGLIINSNIAFSIQNIFTLDSISYLGFIIIAILLLIFSLISFRILKLVGAGNANLLTILLSFVFGIAIYIFLDIVYFREKLQLFIPFAVVVGIMLYREKYYKRSFNFGTIILYIFVFSVFSTLALNFFKNYKEKEYRKILAIDLATEKDPVGESIFLEIEQAVKNDAVLKRIIAEYPGYQEDAIRRIANHFKGYWSKYDILITLCNSVENLIIKPSYVETNCHEFFNGMIADIGQHTLSSSLYYLENNSGKNSYLAIFELKNDTLELPKIFVELNSKFIPKDLGYPELLIDKKTMRRNNLENYSYAKYKNRELFTNYGKYFYNINLTRSPVDSIEYFFYDLNGYNHLSYRSGENARVIISRQRESFLDTISPFSYLFILFSFICFLFVALVIKPTGFLKIQPNLKSRIQFAITIIVLISFFLIGSGSIVYIYNIYHKKNISLITEKMHSLLIELEHKLANEDALTPDMEEYLTDLLIKFQNVFFTDINLYDLDGNLLASSRPKIFSEGLISTKMNASAFNELRKNKQFFYFHEERIGSMNYMSVYVPFRNDRNQHIAYLNLPYFAKQDELQDEISSFLVTFVNVYLLLIALAVIIAIIISTYITKPLQLIKEKLSKIIYGKQNEKIEWNKKDELGGLIVEYNRMVDELVQSATLLAQSERESAWREMAKQVAHEIKNPLTPMKLNVQYLQRAWKNKEPDWDIRLERFAESIIEQIDTLSKIASEFSDFAKMPRTTNQKVELVPILKSAVDLFMEDSNLSISLVINVSGKAYVFADKEQLLRVFNNLLKNSIQAKQEKVKCLINISLNLEEQFYKISVEDNGKGIPDELKEKIFSPNFTTKSSGMGLGLAMVHNIISSAGGKIEFESQKDVGTVFNIWLPKYVE